MTHPTQFRYTKEHEWVDLEGNHAKVGITEHAQDKLGDIVFVELPAVGTAVKKGENLATVESVKAVGDIYAPMSGAVVEVNTQLESSPETINQDPYGAGWLVILEVSDPSEADSLLDASGYEQYLNEG
ncbi:glycine cleavage system protein GcvH [Candidatus Bipolaricaulota bacterium]|nr:glycine cleavage system protein GcvH [Candidatus Bipolaricaulota bacterium]MCK4600637.1 glycine cleavage system protein GcvH [Candidatus Bipolaricaulota bacterium]